MTTAEIDRRSCCARDWPEPRWVSNTSFGDDVPVLSLLAALGSAVCFAEAALVVRRFPHVHPMTLNAVGMATGGVLLLIGSVLVREAKVLPERGSTWAALAYLVAVGSVLVFVLYVVVLSHWPASRAASGFVLTRL